MENRFRVLLFALCACVHATLGQDVVRKAARLHANWNFGRRMEKKNHFTCTLEIEEPLEYFRVNFTSSTEFYTIETWSLDLLEKDQYSALFRSKRTMYPPRVVLNFHTTHFGISFGTDSVNCTWDSIGMPRPRPAPQPRPAIPNLGGDPLSLPPASQQGRKRRRASRSVIVEDSSAGGDSNARLPGLELIGSRPIPRPRPRPGPLIPTTEAPTIILDCGLTFDLLPDAVPVPEELPSLPPPTLLSGAPPALPGDWTRASEPILPEGLIQPTSFSAYQDAIKKSMYFYAAQRSGSLPEDDVNSHIEWLRSSGLDHVAPNGTNLTGGWYNGNDAVKINFPMASSVTVLATGVYLWPESYLHFELREQIVDTLRWPLDYFLKCWNNVTETLYVQVGDLKEDRALFERVDNDVYNDLVSQNKWPFYSVTPDKPGSDVAAEMASAMAVSSMALSRVDFSGDAYDYQRTLFNTAKELYNFAVKYPGKYSDHVDQTSTEYPTYVSSGYKDELCLAAILLYVADYNENHLRDARTYFTEAADAEELFSWDNKYPLCAAFLYMQTGEDQYATYVSDFVRHWVDGQYTPGGLAYQSGKGTLRYTANAVFISLVAESFELFQEQDLHDRAMKFSLKQFGYILGQNSDFKSYLIGYGDNYPKSPFHKNSACPHPAKQCGWGFYDYALLKNMNELTGALVGGPNDEDQYRDSRLEKIQNSVALDYNAGFQSAAAGLESLKLRLQRSCAIEPEPEFSTESSTLYSSTWEWSSEGTTDGLVTPRLPPQTPPPPPPPTTTRVTQTTKFTTPPPTDVPPQPTTFRYSEALGKSILFYEAQRDGLLPEDYPIEWRKNSAAFGSPADVQGGWFDDGSKLRTTIAMASSATLLCWGGYAFKDGYQQSEHLEHLQNILVQPGTYFLTMWQGIREVVIKSARNEGYVRAFWARPSDDLVSLMFEQRLTIREVGAEGEGADILAEMATALAIGSRISSPTGSNSDTNTFELMLLTAAQEMYANATELSSAYNDIDSLHYSGSSDASDEMCIAAAWLYKLTNITDYLTDAKAYIQKDYKKELTWENKHVLCELIMYEITGQSKYRKSVKAFVEHWMGDEMLKTPGGLAWSGEKGPLAHAANAAFVSLLAADQGIKPEEYRAWAKSQIDYMLGKNDRAYSYLIGYSDRFPRRPHHRGSSCPEYMEVCDWSIYNAPGPNPHVLTGALVGGPDANDMFEDARTNYTMNRVAVDYNAGFQSALAGLIQVFGLESTSPTAKTAITTTTAVPKPPTDAPTPRPQTDALTPRPRTGPPTLQPRTEAPPRPTTTTEKDQTVGPVTTETSKASAVSFSLTTAVMLLVIRVFA